MVRSTIKITKMTEKEIIEIVRAYGLISGTIVFREDVVPDRLVDFLAGNRVYIPSITVVNKYDQSYEGVEKNIRKYVEGDYLKLSVKNDQGVEKLKKLLFDSLNFMRIYLKPHGGPADMKEPLVILEGSTVKAICEHLHRDFVDLFRFANVWGPSAKYPGQLVGVGHVLKDGDVVTIAADCDRMFARLDDALLTVSQIVHGENIDRVVSPDFDGGRSLAINLDLNIDRFGQRNNTARDDDQ